MSLESATYIADLNSSNPAAGDQVLQGDDHLRLLKAAIKATLPTLSRAVYLDQAKADVASATTTDIGAATTNWVRITGTTTITGLGTAGEGIWRYVYFSAALTLTHNATSLILPGAASITTAAGDSMLAVSAGSGNWRVLFFQKADGTAIVASTLGISSLTEETVPVASDMFPFYDVSATANRKATITNIIAAITNLLKSDTEDQTISGGAEVTAKNLGTVSTGTTTIDPADRPIQYYTNNGAHTLAPHGTKYGVVAVDVTNGASAGAITTSGFTKVTGDSFDTTNGHKFTCSVKTGPAGSWLNVQAMQ